MKKQLLLLALFLFLSTAGADAISDKIQVGLTKDAVIAIFGGSPDAESCKTTLGLTSCSLTWTKGFLSRDVYEVTLVAGRVISVSSSIKK